MRVIRILQISDILASSEGRAPHKVFDELAAWVDKNSPGKRFDVVDYIVICGNVTADGKPESYAKALELLRELGNKLLVKDEMPGQRWKTVTRLNRMLIVPGRTDIRFVAQTSCSSARCPDFAAFQMFHDQLFSEEITAGRVVGFDPGHAMCRELRDLTLIGVSYWETGKPHLTKGLLKTLETEVKGATDRLSQFEYAKCAPKVLVSAAYPFFNWDVRDTYKNIRRIFSDDLRISLHLFGSGSVVGMLPEPFSLPHIGLGTGPRGKKGFWPFRANLIEMCVGADEEESGEDGPIEKQKEKIPLISNYVFQRLEEDDGIERRDHIKGHLDLFFKPAEGPPAKSIYNSFLSKIGKQIFEGKKRFILITGLPGSGKEEFLRLLKKQSDLDGHPIKVISISLGTHNRQMLQRELTKAKAKILEDQQVNNRTIILAVRDLCFHELARSGDKEKIAEFFSPENFNDFSLFHNDLPLVKAVLYVVSRSNYELPLDVTVGSMLEKVALPPLETEAIKLLVRQYSRRAPVVEFELDNITGGYAGFSKILLDEAETDFKDESGAEPINRDTSSRLMKRALLSSKKLKAEARLYLKSIEGAHLGKDVSKYIKDEINKLKKGQEITSPLDSLQVSISAKKLKKMILPGERANLQDTLDRFESLGILAKDSADKDLYKLRVVAPFLIDSSSSPPGAPRTTDVSEGSLMNTKETPIDFLIVTALKQEREAVLNLLPNAQKLDPTESDIYTYHAANVPVTMPQGTKGAYNVVVMSYLGMGRVQATLATATAITRWRPRCVLLVGIAGGFREKGVKLGDLLIAKQIIDYELQKLTEGGDDIRWQLFNTDPQLCHSADNFEKSRYEHLLPTDRPDAGAPEVIFGDIASGDKVDKRSEWMRKFGQMWPKVIGIEMEAAGAAVAALQDAYHPKFFMVRGVSDYADREADSSEVSRWRQYACDVAASYALAFLNSGPLHFASTVEASQAVEELRQSSTAVSSHVEATRTSHPEASEDRTSEAQQGLSVEELSQLADLLKRSGKAELDSRKTLCMGIGLGDSDDLSFLKLQKSGDFASHLVSWLHQTGNREALLKLCRAIAPVLKGDQASQLKAILAKLI